MHNGRERRKYERKVFEKGNPCIARFRVKQYEDSEISFGEWDTIVLRVFSAGGALFFHKKDLGIGTLLDLKIDIPKSTTIVNSVGKILRIDKIHPTSVFCIAIEFIDIGEQEKELISKAIEEM
jgi:hypothetical protein